jgi:serine/threonine protein kinase
VLQDLGALPERAVALIGYEVLKVVATCHRHNVLHGDVKPANFVLKHRRDNPLYSPDLNLLFSPWLIAIDFGCSQYLTSKRFNKRTGTPVYMAPEIFERDYHWEADMWSVGIMLYQLYARRFPFWDTYEACRSAKLDEVQVLVQEGPLPLDYGPWLHMSEAGLNFMRGCLERDYASRMTVDEALDHPWFDNWLPEEEASPAALDSLSTSEEEDLLATPAAAAAAGGGSGGSRVAAVPPAGAVAAAALQQQAAAAGAAARRLLQRPSPPGHKPQPLGSSSPQQQPQQQGGSILLPPKQLVHPSGVPLAPLPSHQPQALQHQAPQLQPLQPAVAAGQTQEQQQSQEQQRQQHHQLRAPWQQSQQQQQQPGHAPSTGSSGALRAHSFQESGGQQPVALEQMQEVSSNGTGGADVPAAVEPAPAAAHNKAG